DGKLSAQSFEHPLPALLPEMRNVLGIAVRDEAMPARFQVGSLFDIIKQLTVKDDKGAPVLIGHRLLPIRETDDAKPARRHDDPRPPVIPLFVRAAMHDGIRHPADDFISRGSTSG